MKTKNEEKRTFKRVEKVLNVRLSDILEKTSELESFTCKCLNISANGMLLNIDHEFSVGKKFKVLFLKPNTFYFFDGKAKVIRTEKSDENTFNMGIEFEDVENTENKMMDFYLNS